MEAGTSVPRRRMTAEEAKRFERFSMANAAHVERSLTCGCRAYDQVFTMKRWNAMGYSVVKGSKAIRLPLVRLVEAVDAETQEPVYKRMLGTSWVFCAHQVQPYARRNGAAHTPVPATKDQRRYEAEEGVAALQEALKQDGVGDLTRFVNKDSGEIGTIPAGALARMGAIPSSTASYKRDSRPAIPWEYALDAVATERSYADAEALKSAIEAHVVMKHQLAMAQRQLVAGAYQHERHRSDRHEHWRTAPADSDAGGVEGPWSQGQAI